MKTLPATALRSNGADYLRTYHHVEVSPDVTLDDLLRPAFWAHHTTTLRVNDLVDVLTSDGGLDCQFRVIGKGVGYVTLRPLRIWQREEAKAATEPGDDDLPLVPDGYAVNFAPRTKWRVFTTDPHIEISRDHASRREAIEAAIAHNAKANPVAA